MTVKEATGITSFLYYVNNKSLPGFANIGHIKFQRYFVTNGWLKTSKDTGWRPIASRGWNFKSFLQQAKELGIRTVWSTQGGFDFKPYGSGDSINKRPPYGNNEDPHNSASYKDVADHCKLVAAIYGKNVKVTAADIAPLMDTTTEVWTYDMAGNRVNVKNIPEVGLDLISAIQPQNEAWFYWTSYKMDGKAVAICLHECYTAVRSVNDNIEFWAPSTLDLNAQLYQEVNAHHIELYGEPVPSDVVFDPHEYFSKYDQWGNRILGGATPEAYKNPNSGVSNGLNVPQFVEQVEQLFPGRRFVFSEGGYSHSTGSVLHVPLPGFNNFQSKAICDLRMVLWYLTQKNTMGSIIWHSRDGDGPANKDGTCGIMTKVGDSPQDTDDIPEYTVRNQSMWDVYAEFFEQLGDFPVPAKRIKTDNPYAVLFAKGTERKLVAWTEKNPGTITFEGKNYSINARPQYFILSGGTPRVNLDYVKSGNVIVTVK